MTTCRAATSADEPFLRSLLTSLIAAELGADAWPASLREQIVNMQYDARIQSQRVAFPQAENRIIEADDEPCGWLATAILPGEIRLIDIVVAPARRGQGIGTVVIRQVLAQAGELNLSVTLHVHVNNPRALRLYEELGFERTGGDEVRHSLRSRSSSA